MRELLVDLRDRILRLEEENDELHRSGLHNFCPLEQRDLGWRSGLRTAVLLGVLFAVAALSFCLTVG